ncbi:hypothetical protein K504DRAFT_523472, partial [Pleomassaria siparia CBS 279.74]
MDLAPTAPRSSLITQMRRRLSVLRFLLTHLTTFSRLTLSVFSLSNTTTRLQLSRQLEQAALISTSLSSSTPLMVYVKQRSSLVLYYQAGKKLVFGLGTPKLYSKSFLLLGPVLL